MSAGRALRARTYTLIGSMIFFSSLGNVLLGKGMKQVGAIVDFSPAVVALTLLRVFTNGAIWLGILSLILFLISYMVVLSWADLSYVLPASALGYAVVAFLGYLLLGEFVSPARWIGVFFICSGVALVGGTSPTTKAGGG